MVHGVDTASTGLLTLWTGEIQHTLTEQAVTNVTGSPTAGAAVDFPVGVLPSLGIGIATRAAPAAAAKQVAEQAAVKQTAGAVKLTAAQALKQELSTFSKATQYGIQQYSTLKAAIKGFGIRGTPSYRKEICKYIGSRY